MTTVKGLLVEIGGDTSGLQKALSKVNSASSSLSRELRGINSLLKLDPKNTELLAQKQTVLANNIKETEDKLKLLKKAQEEADKTIKSGGKISQENYRNLQREIITTENKLKNLKLEASNWNKVSKCLDTVSTKMKNLGNKISSIGQKMSVITAGLAGIGGLGIKSAMEQEAAIQQIDKIYGKASKTIKSFAKNTASSYNMSTKDAYKYSQIYGNLIQSITDDEEENATYTQQLLKASSVIASATGRTMEDVMDRIRSGLLGNTEAIEDLGVNVNVSLLESTDAFKKFAGDKSWNQFDFQTQQQIRLFGILEQTTKKYGDEVNNNTTTKVQKLTAKMQNLATTIGEKLLPYFTKALDIATEFTSKFENLSPKTQDLIIKAGLFVAAIGPVLLIIGKIITSISSLIGGISQLSGWIASISTSAGGLSGILASLTNPVGLIIAGVAALTAAVVYLYNTNEKIKASIDEIIQKYLTKVQELVNFLTPYIQKALDWFRNFWDTNVKDTLNNLKLLLQEFFVAAQLFYDKFIFPVADFMLKVFKPAFTVAFNVIGTALKTTLQNITTIINTIINIFRGLIQFITGVFTGDWRKGLGRSKKYIFFSFFRIRYYI